MSLTLREELAGDRDQHAVSHPLRQGAPCSPFPRSEKSETGLEAEASRGLKPQRFAPWEPLGMLTAQERKGSSVFLSYRIHVGVSVTL